MTGDPQGWASEFRSEGKRGLQQQETQHSERVGGEWGKLAGLPQLEDVPRRPCANTPAARLPRSSPDVAKSQNEDRLPLVTFTSQVPKAPSLDCFSGNTPPGTHHNGNIPGTTSLGVGPTA